MTGTNDSTSRRDLQIGLGLILITLLVFGQTSHFRFISLDDASYVQGNPHLYEGFTLKSLRWAFGAGLTFHTPYTDYWQPMTILSRILDAMLYNQEAGGHHITNVVLHVLTVLLLFAWLRRTTGAVKPSAFVAAMFAVHPLQVESVAWITARKDVLSAFFLLLTLWSYYYYIQRPSCSRYLLVSTTFLLALMSKPMVVTLPCLLLLLDYWPLRRMEGKPRPARTLLHLALEKLPLLGLSLAVSFITFFGVPRAYSTPSSKFFLSSIPATYGWYFAHFIWPMNLSIRSPDPAPSSPWQMLLSVIFICGVTILVVRETRRRPYLIVGWFWFLVALLPVLTIRSYSDRYMYTPMIGLLIAVTWEIRSHAKNSFFWKKLVPYCASLLILASVAASWQQTHYWKDGTAVFQHALALSPDNWLAHAGLAHELADRGHSAEALSQYQQAIDLNPLYTPAYIPLAELLQEHGQTNAAERAYRQALQVNPTYAPAHLGLANLMSARGETKLALSQLTLALQSDPDSAEAHNNFANLLAKTGHLDEAIAHYRTAIRLSPGNAERYYNLANALVQQQHYPEALAQFQQALYYQPNHAMAHTNLGGLLLILGQPGAAETQFRLALQADPNLFEAEYNLGVALRSQGKLDEARQHFRAAAQLRPDRPEPRQALEEIPH